jgi:anti-sigma regulatory factor (Ser/Thr protein kinase)
MNEAPTQHVEFVHQTWRAHPRQLASIRAEARRWLTSLRLPDDAKQDIVFAVSEAASNVVEHAYARTTSDDTVELTFWTEARAVCIEIVDHGRWKVPSTGPDGRGRGLPIMRNLVEFVLVHYDARGTRVLLRQPLTPAGPAVLAP